MQLTPEQAAVVSAPVNDLLVSAAAGSGKTAVMTERIVSRIVADQLSISDVLVMTFTEAAARQMKEKISGKLDDARKTALEPALRQRLSRQQTLLPGCAISTIHAFCLTVIRNFSHLAIDDLGDLLIEPGFAVSDPQVADLLLGETLDEVLAARFERIDLEPDEQARPWTDDFLRLVDSFSNSRGDDPLRQQIIRLYQYLRSMPDYRNRVEIYRRELAQAAQDFSHSRHAEVLRDQLRVLLGQAIAALPDLEDLLDTGVTLIKDPVRNAAYHAQFRRIATVLRELGHELGQGAAGPAESVDSSGSADAMAWDRIVELAQKLNPLELPSLSGRGHSDDKKALIQLFRQNLAESIHCLTGQCHTDTYRKHFLFDTRCLFARTSWEIEQDIAEMLPVIDQLFDLVLELDSLYRDRKREQVLVDFGDFEHLALQILRQPEATEYYRARYHEIYIDEYQDTSSIQEAILRAIGNNNIFMVGDVKQSIYRFRHARPQIFIGRAETYKSSDSGQLQTLNRNFRSVSGILEAVNEVFGQLMTIAAGEIDYDQSQALVPHREEQAEHPPVELILIDPSAGPTGSAGTCEQENNGSADATGLNTVAARGSEADVAPGSSDSDDELEMGARSSTSSRDEAEPQLDAAELSQYEREAIVVRHKITQLLSRGHEPKDIVILARTRAIVRVFATELAASSVATLEDTGNALLDNPEMHLMHALLQVMDNPLQDIPLAAVMRSRLCEGGFSPQDLLAIRTAATSCRYFHEAVAWYAQNGQDPALRDQVERFGKWLDRWRAKEKTLKIGEWLNLLLETCDFFGQVAAGEGGTAKLKVLRAFIDWIHTYEKNRRRGLFDLVRHLENLEHNGIAQAPFDLEVSQQNAVRVMTIHRSKGLEFPVVFLVGLAAGITPKDQQAMVMISETLGVGFDWIDPEQHQRRMTHLKLAMLAENKAAALAEELRLLYVAMTRARDRLLMTASLPKSGNRTQVERLNRARSCTDQTLPPHLVLSGRSYLDWLILALSRHPDLDWSVLDPGTETESQPGLPAESGCGLVQPTRKAWSLSAIHFANWIADLPDDMPSPTAPETIHPYQATQQLCQLLHPLSPGEESLVEQAQRRIRGEYPFTGAARRPIKLSVSELKRLEQDETLYGEDQSLVIGESDWPENLPSVSSDDRDDLIAGTPRHPTARGINLDLRPLILPQTEDTPLQGASLGTLLHSFLRYLDLPSAQSAGTLENLKTQLAAMVETKLFNAREGEAIHARLGDVLAFVHSDLAARMAEAEVNRRQLYREMLFTLALEAAAVWPGETGFASDDRALIQGIIDCWFQENDRAVLVDYKSDCLTWSTPGQLRTLLAARYGRQLNYYAQAIEAATHLPVSERIIVHLPSRSIFSWTAAELATALPQQTGLREEH